MKEKVKMGRPFNPNKKKKISVSISTAAYKNYLKMPEGYRSIRISNFLERADPKVRIEGAGSRTGHPDARDQFGNKYETEPNIQKEETNE